MRYAQLFVLAVILVFITGISAAQAQVLAPPPPQHHRQPQTPPAPFEHTPRGPVMTVNTTADGNDGACEALDVGLGTDCTLREALEVFVPANPDATIYLPFADYILDVETLGAITVSGSDFTLIGSPEYTNQYQFSHLMAEVGMPSANTRLLDITMSDNRVTLVTAALSV